jgi:flagellar motor protein MotB
VYGMLARCEPRLLQLQTRDNQPVMGASGYGETRRLEPVDRTAAVNDPARTENRRIDLRFLMRLPDDIDNILNTSDAVSAEVNERLRAR